jgi:hypothetical protein
LFPVLPRPRPRREIFAWLRPSLAAAWRRATLALGAASAHARRKAQAGAAGLVAALAGAAGFVAALSVWRIDRRRVGFALAGLVMGLSTGIVAIRTRASTKVDTAQTEAPVSAAAVALASPVAVSPSVAPPQQGVRSSPEFRSRRAGASNRQPHIHRKPAPASSSAKRPPPTTFMDRETYWARAGQSAPVSASRPLFSR